MASPFLEFIKDAEKGFVMRYEWDFVQWYLA